MKKLLVTLSILFIFLAIPFNVSAKENAKLYPQTTVIVKYENNMMYCMDFNGNIWTILCEEEYSDYFVGDIISMVMCDNGTPNSIYDDIIVSYRYDGWVENWGYQSDGQEWSWKYEFKN